MAKERKTLRGVVILVVPEGLVLVILVILVVLISGPSPTGAASELRG